MFFNLCCSRDCIAKFIIERKEKDSLIDTNSYVFCLKKKNMDNLYGLPIAKNLPLFSHKKRISALSWSKSGVRFVN